MFIVGVVVVVVVVAFVVVLLNRGFRLSRGVASE